MQIINLHPKKNRKVSKYTHKISFLSYSEKKLQLLLISKVYHFYLFEK